MQSIWDLPELMMQANSWPMVPQLGAFLCTPSPMTGDGLSISGDGKKILDHVIDMLHGLSKHPSNPDPKIMELEKYWHPNVNWYGPAGIGTGRGISVLDIGIEFLFCELCLIVKEVHRMKN